MSEVYDDYTDPHTHASGWHVWTIPITSDSHSPRVVTICMPTTMSDDEINRLMGFLDSFRR